MNRTGHSAPVRAHAAVLAAGLLIAVHASAADTTFQPALTLGQWFEPANWSNGLPGFGTEAFIAGSKIAVIRDKLAETARLNIGNEANKTGVVEISDTNGAGWEGSALYLGLVKDSTGRVVMAGGTFKAGVATEVGIIGKGIIRQLGGTSSHNLLDIGAGTKTGEGDGTYEMLGGKATIGSLYLSRFGYGSGLFSQSGGEVEVNSLAFRIESENSAQYKLSGGKLTVTPDAKVAVTKNGTFEQTGGEAIFQASYYNGGTKFESGLDGSGTAIFTIKTGADKTSISETLYNFQNATINISAKSTVTVPVVDNSRGGKMNVDGNFSNGGRKTRIINAGMGRLNIQDEFGGIGVCSIDGDFTQADGILGIHIVGFNAGQFSVLQGTGLASLGGMLQVDFLSGATIELFKLIKIVDFSGGIVSGQFDLFDLPSLPAGLWWEVHQGTDFVGLEVVPAPGAAGALIGGALWAVRRRRA